MKPQAIIIILVIILFPLIGIFAVNGLLQSAGVTQLISYGIDTWFYGLCILFLMRGEITYDG